MAISSLQKFSKLRGRKKKKKAIGLVGVKEKKKEFLCLTTALFLWSYSNMRGKFRVLTSNLRVSKTCVILLLLSREKSETLLISDYFKNVKKYF